MAAKNVYISVYSKNSFYGKLLDEKTPHVINYTTKELFEECVPEEILCASEDELRKMHVGFSISAEACEGYDRTISDICKNTSLIKFYGFKIKLLPDYEESFDDLLSTIEEIKEQIKSIKCDIEFIKSELDDHRYILDRLEEKVEDMQ